MGIHNTDPDDLDTEFILICESLNTFGEGLFRLTSAVGEQLIHSGSRHIFGGGLFTDLPEDLHRRSIAVSVVVNIFERGFDPVLNGNAHADKRNTGIAGVVLFFALGVNCDDEWIIRTAVFICPQHHRSGGTFSGIFHAFADVEALEFGTAETLNRTEGIGQRPVDAGSQQTFFDPAESFPDTHLIRSDLMQGGESPEEHRPEDQYREK